MLYQAATYLEDQARTALLKASSLWPVQATLPTLPPANRRPPGEPLRFMFTIDTEISLGGALADPSLAPVGADRRIWCETQAGRFGIETFMDVFEENGLRGVFFFEPFGAKLVDPTSMEAAAKRITDRGHEVQLHIHPEFRIDLEETRRIQKTPSPFLREYAPKEQRAMLKEGADILQRWTGQRPTAFRAGSFGFDEVGVQACKDEGLIFDSSYNLWSLERGECAFNETPAINDVAIMDNGIIEVPLTNLMTKYIRGGYRCFDLASLNTTEMIAALETMHQAGAWVCCSLTHSFRLLKTTNVQMSDARPDHFNLHRLRALCRYLAAHRERFQVCTFNDLPVARWRKTLAPPPEKPHCPTPPVWTSLTRMAVQAIKDRGAI